MRWIAEDRKKTRPNPMGLRLHSLLNYGIVWRQRAALDAGRFFWFFFFLGDNENWRESQSLEEGARKDRGRAACREDVSGIAKDQRAAEDGE